MLSVDSYSHHYGVIPSIDGVSLKVQKGEIVSLIGANGAGKTTLLRSISGMLRGKGTIEFDGQKINSLKPHEIVRLGMSHVPERRGIFANLTVYENLLIGAYTRKLTSYDLEEVYTLFPRLKERERQMAGTLSGGEQQMLAVSRALLSKPKLILLDEPSLGLAPQITKFIFEIIVKINQSGTTVLLVEQNAFAALKVSHRAYVLEVGKIVLEGTSTELIKNDVIRKTYLGEVA